MRKKVKEKDVVKNDNTIRKKYPHILYILYFPDNYKGYGKIALK